MWAVPGLSDWSAPRYEGDQTQIKKYVKHKLDTFKIYLKIEKVVYFKISEDISTFGASSQDQIKMNKIWLEYDRKIMKTMNINNWTWLKIWQQQLMLNLVTWLIDLKDFYCQIQWLLWVFKIGTEHNKIIKPLTFSALFVHDLYCIIYDLQ